MVYFHGNGEDIGDNVYMFHEMRNYLQVNVFAVEYAGYGKANTIQEPTPEKIKSDAADAYQFLQNKLGFAQENIVLFGRSIGSGPACHLANVRSDVRSVVLMSPFLSIERFGMDLKRKDPLSNFFDNGKALQATNARLLIIHGEKDTLIPMKQAEALV